MQPQELLLQVSPEGSVSLAKTCTFLAVLYREDVPEDDLEPPVTMKSGDMDAKAV